MYSTVTQYLYFFSQFNFFQNFSNTSSLMWYAQTLRLVFFFFHYFQYQFLFVHRRVHTLLISRIAELGNFSRYLLAVQCVVHHIVLVVQCIIFIVRISTHSTGYLPDKIILVLLLKSPLSYGQVHDSRNSVRVCTNYFNGVLPSRKGKHIV